MTTTAAIPGITGTLPMTSASSPNELFALTDEQILEIEPVAQAESSSPADGSKTQSSAEPSKNAAGLSPRATSHTAQAGMPVPLEPPPWLAAQMKDPWNGDEARDLWDGVQRARQEAAAFREVFAKPENARTIVEETRALKELYPGGVEQARAAAERARTLEEIDTAFYGATGKSPEQQSAGRAALAQRMLREDPAAFREMVFAGLHALEEAGNATQMAAQDVAAAFRPPSDSAGAVQSTDGHLKVAATNTQFETSPGPVGARHAVPAPPATEHPHFAAYRSFEKSANEELERSVGGAINRALEQALPVAQPILAMRGDVHTSIHPQGTDKTAQPGVAPLHERLGGAIRADVEAALKGDAQLGEQIAQLLSARRFDDSTRAQVVRLINDRAQQLVPGSARRVIQDWTQTAFAAHRGRSESASVAQGESASPAGSRERTSSTRAASPAISARAAAADRAENAVDLSHRATSRLSGRPVDYRKLSDEQILEL